LALGPVASQQIALLHQEMAALQQQLSARMGSGFLVAGTAAVPRRPSPEQQQQASSAGVVAIHAMATRQQVQSTVAHVSPTLSGDASSKSTSPGTQPDAAVSPPPPSGGDSQALSSSRAASRPFGQLFKRRSRPHT
jgi:hypothetical protein